MDTSQINSSPYSFCRAQIHFHGVRVINLVTLDLNPKLPKYGSNRPAKHLIVTVLMHNGRICGFLGDLTRICGDLDSGREIQIVWPECHENGPEPYKNYMGRTEFGWNPRICGFYGEPRPISGSTRDIGAPTALNAGDLFD